MAEQESATGRQIEVNGASIWYEEHGKGAPLLLVNPGLASSGAYKPLLPFLGDDFRVITPDSRGHGRSSNPSGQLSYPQLADDVATLIGMLGLERPVVGGWSDGGQVALEVGVRHPGAAAALIIGAAYPDLTQGDLVEGYREMLGADEAGVPDLDTLDINLGDYREMVRSAHAGGPDQWRALVEQTAPMWLDYPGLSPDQLAAIETPALVLAGDRDPISAELLVSLYRALPKAELAILPHADHGGIGRPEHVALFGAVMRSFAQRHAAPDGRTA